MPDLGTMLLVEDDRVDVESTQRAIRIYRVEERLTVVRDGADNREIQVRIRCRDRSQGHATTGVDTLRSAVAETSRTGSAVVHPLRLAYRPTPAGDPDLLPGEARSDRGYRQGA